MGSCCHDIPYFLPISIQLVQESALAGNFTLKNSINWMQLRNQNSHAKFQLKLATYFHFLLVEACVSTFLSVIMDQTWFHFICLSACKFNTRSASFFFFFPHIFFNAFTNVALCIYIYIFSLDQWLSSKVLITRICFVFNLLSSCLQLHALIKLYKNILLREYMFN